MPGDLVRCLECGTRYPLAGRGDGGLSHFMVVTMRGSPDGCVRVTGHWRCGDWIPGQTLELCRRDGHRVAIFGAEMEPPLNAVCEKRGQRTLLVPHHQSLQPRGCIHALDEDPAA